MERLPTCAEFEILLADWMDDRRRSPIQEAERRAFLRHLESCGACELLADDARFAISFMERAAEVEFPPVLVAKILRAIPGDGEIQPHGRGWSGWVNRRFAPVLRPRLVMSAALTLMSLGIVAQGFGWRENTFTRADLNPMRLWTSLNHRTHRIQERLIKSYDTAPLVFEVRNRIDDWAGQQWQESEPSSDGVSENWN